RGRTWVVMCVDATAVALNLVLDGMWVLGWGGVAVWGFEGAAWATVVAQWSRVGMYSALMLQPAHRREFNTLAGMAFDPDELRRLVRFGGPSGVQMLLDVGAFTLFVQFIGTLGPTPTEATSLVFRISHVAFMPVWGLGMATVVLVGQRLGENRPELARRAARTTLTLAWGYMGVISLLLVAAPRLFLQIFDVESAEAVARHEEVHALAASLMRFVAAYNMFDATLIIFSSVLRGAGDTRYIMQVSLVAALALVSVTWSAVAWGGVGVMACWTIVTGWVWLVAAAYIVRYRQGRWQSMRVIEQRQSDEPPDGVDFLGGDLTPAPALE
ncbi:MAG TPA: MATE family efflux transporter, partial [Lacipirellulaceae bacterium]|nr:MATE family efflux transporter [Lacipirellulaceae bacterium]